MHRSLRLVLLSLPTVAVAAFLSACSGGGDDDKAACDLPTAPAATGTAPAGAMDLSHWQLTLPVDANGNPSGTADTVSTSELVSGYSSNWFYRTENDGVTFWSPIQGATTAHTIYPRSELREVFDPADPAHNWTSTDVSELNAFLIVHQVPSANGKVTIGEIVGYNRDNPDVSVLTKLVYEYNTSTCTATLSTTTLGSPTASGSTATHQVLTRSLHLGEGFPYTIRVENNTITFTSGMTTVTEPIGPEWNGIGLIYRAGASLFAAGPSLEDGARVTFYQLQATHG
jgi:hypothetical protein